MIEKELREIKRRYRPDKHNIPKIVGCLVNTNKEIVSKINQPLGLSDSIVSEKLLTTMKKTLSGSLGTNLTNISFSTKDVLEGEQHKLLTTLVKSRLADEEALDTFYSKVIESLSFETNYAILLSNDVYDVFSYNKDGTEGESTESFSYIIAAVCPVKTLPEALSFRESDSLFHTLNNSSLLSSPELGFMFPAFDDRKTNIYGALYYTRSISENYPNFTKNIFDREAAMPPKTQKNAFNECLSTALSEDCSLELVRSVHAQINEMVEEHKASKDPEPLTINKPTVNRILANCGVEEEKIEKLDSSFDETFGKNAELTPKNIISANKFEHTMPSVTIKVAPEHRDAVTTEVINNVKYVMIRVTGPVEINGIHINVDDE